MYTITETLKRNASATRIYRKQILQNLDMNEIIVEIIVRFASVTCGLKERSIIYLMENAA